MVVIPNGKIGQIALRSAEEDDAAAIDNVPTLCHKMAEKPVHTLDRRLRQRTVIQTAALVNILIFCYCTGNCCRGCSYGG